MPADAELNDASFELNEEEIDLLLESAHDNDES